MKREFKQWRQSKPVLKLATRPEEIARLTTLFMPKKCLCFGLPGTGKTTFVKTHAARPLHLDIGHNAFKSDYERDKFFHKLHKHTTAEIGLLSSIKGSWLYDAYPDYFEVTDLRDYGNVDVIFAIPTDFELDHHIIPRVVKRGDSDTFVDLYKKQGHQWIKDWWKRYKLWKSILGRHRVRVIPAYDSVDWIKG